jgi:hypothetical protein
MRVAARANIAVANYPALQLSRILFFCIDFRSQIGQNSVKTKKMRSVLKSLLFMACILSCGLAVTASANLFTSYPAMAPLQQWTVFSLGGGITDTDTTDELSGNTYIRGNVGVAGSGDINMSGNATIDGNLVYRSNGTLKMSGGSKVNGATIHGGDSNLDASSLAAMNTSTYYGGLPSTDTRTSFTGNGNVTILGAPGNNVFNLTNFTLSGGTFTLVGTAATNFIFNISNQFSLSGAAQIVLSGAGFTSDNVLFNVTTPGSKVDLSGQSSLQGIVMANQRTVNVTGGSIVKGRVIANKVTLSGSSQIVSQ